MYITYETLMIIHQIFTVFSFILANAMAGVIGAIAVLLIVVSAIVVMIVILIVCKKQPPTVQREQVYDEVDDIPKTDQDYEELDVNKMDDDVMTSKDYQKLNVRKMDPLNDKVMNKRGHSGWDASKRNDELYVIGEDYEELDLRMLDETTNYASLK